MAPLDSQQQIWILSGSWPCPARSGGRAEQLLVVACGGLSFALRRISLGKCRQVLEGSAGGGLCRARKAHKLGL